MSLIQEDRGYSRDWTQATFNPPCDQTWQLTMEIEGQAFGPFVTNINVTDLWGMSGRPQWAVFNGLETFYAEGNEVEKGLLDGYPPDPFVTVIDELRNTKGERLELNGAQPAISGVVGGLNISDPERLGFQFMSKYTPIPPP